MCVELVEEIHDGLYVENAGADDHVFVTSRRMLTVLATRLLSLDPRRRDHFDLETNSPRLYLAYIYYMISKNGDLRKCNLLGSHFLH